MSDQKKNSPVQVTGDSGYSISPKMIIAVVIGVVSLMFIFSNSGTANLKFLMWTFSAPGWLMFLLIMLAGAAIGFYLGRNRYKNGK